MVLLALVATGAGCGADGAASSSTRRDSAGIAIVESSAPAWGPGDAWTVDPEPILDLAESGEGDAHAFFGVQDAIRLADGTIVVADGRAGEVRYFDAAGEFIRATGRRGAGPGEFQGLASIHRFRGDSLVAVDGRARRLTVLGPQGAAVRVISLEPHIPRALYPLDDSTLIATLFAPDVVEGADPGIVRRPQPVVRFDLAGEVIDTVAKAAGPEGVSLPMEGGVADARPLFGRNSHLEAHEGRFYLGSADEMEYRVHASDGRLERVVRVPAYDLELTAAALEAEREARLGVNSSLASRELLDRLPVPSRRPAYADLIVDREGYVWAGEHNGDFVNFIGWEPRDWEVFDPEGEWLGTVRFPPRFVPFEIGPDYVLGLLRDELDVEHVQSRRLRRSR